MYEILKNGLINLYFPNIAALVAGIIAIIAAGYLLGSLNFAIIISRVFYHDDIRKYGSGNAGMSNMLRTYGKGAAALTFFGDAAKTVIAVFLGRLLIGQGGFGLYGDYLGAFAVIAGHCFPAFYKFKGGKGVVAAAMMVLCTDWLTFLLCVIIFAAIVAATRYMSLGSIVAILVYPLLLSKLAGGGPHVLFACAAAALIVVMHRSNIKRLLGGTESKLSFGKKKDN